MADDKPGLDSLEPKEEPKNDSPSTDSKPKPKPTPTQKKSTGKKRPVAIVSFPEFVAMKEVPGKHAVPLRLYADDISDRPVQEWRDLYEEMMSKPTDMPKEEWRKQFQGKNSK